MTDLTNNSRVRRVTTKIALPVEDSTVGTITLHITGAEAPFVYEVDFANISEQIVFAATLNGISNKFASAYAGAKTPEAVLEAVQKEVAQLATGEFTSRTLREPKVDLPDIVLAWMTSVNVDITDPANVAKYKNAWEGRDATDKAKISENKLVIETLDKILAERRLAKKIKNASTEELEVL